MYMTQWLLIIIIAIPLGFVIAGRLRMDLAALLMAVILGILQLAGMGFLGPENTSSLAILSFSGFSQPVVITLISLFIITRGLEKSGVTHWIAQKLILVGGTNIGRLIALFATVTALLSLFMNNIAAGVLVLPSAMEVAHRTGIKPSKLLIPVAYGSLLGGCATYFTSANIIMSDLLRISDPPQSPLNILSFSPTGGLIAIVGILFLWLFGDRLLPNREPSQEQSFSRLTGTDLENNYQVRERLWDFLVGPNSSLIGKTLSNTEIGKELGITVAAIQHNNEKIFSSCLSEPICQKDHLWVIGREEKTVKLAQFGLILNPNHETLILSQHGVRFAEVLLAPHSRYIGETIKGMGFRKQFNLSVIALKRGDRNFRTDVGDISLAFGDSLLVIGEELAVRSLSRSNDLIVIEPSLIDQPFRPGQASAAIAITFLAIGAAFFGVPVALCMLIGAVVTLLFKIVDMEDAYRSIEWQAIFLIAGMYAVSQAMIQTGLAATLGSMLLSTVAQVGPLGLAAGSYLLTAFFTQFMGGQVTALITGPITISAAISMGVNPQAIAVATAIGCSATFLTPLAHPVNILMIAPANYKFSDFFHSGWLLTIISFIMLMFGMILFWNL